MEWPAAVPDPWSMENGVHIACCSLESEWIYCCCGAKDVMWVEHIVEPSEYGWIVCFVTIQLRMVLNYTQGQF